jgi:hypothetical protein
MPESASSLHLYSTWTTSHLTKLGWHNCTGSATPPGHTRRNYGGGAWSSRSPTQWMSGTGGTCGARASQIATGLPVFNIVTLTDTVQEAMVARSWAQCD